MLKRIRNISSRMTRLAVNDIPTRVSNRAYDFYSALSDGQMALGLPVSPRRMASWQEKQHRAVAKLALVLYYIYLRAAGRRISRERIKKALTEALKDQQIRLTEDVILLTRPQLRQLSVDTLGIDRFCLSAIFEEATQRSIMLEGLRQRHTSGYFDSRVEENDRGEYETVYYRTYTMEGKEIAFRRLAGLEAVKPGDARPAILLVPGFANNSRCYDINESFSMAKDLADSGNWVYLFDPRGMGINKGRLDPYYTVDTLVDNDLPAVVGTIYDRTHGKPALLVGHSMGGIVTENMVLNCSLRCQMDHIPELTDGQKKVLQQLLPDVRKAEARLAMVRGIIHFGAPKFFDRYGHLFFPTALWLNHLARIFGFHQVPLRQAASMATQLPLMRSAIQMLFNADVGELNFLINPQNHRDSRIFVNDYLQRALESVPLGMGFQFLKAIYNGEGFKRMDESRLNYARLTRYLPADIPIFRIWGEKDRMAPPPPEAQQESYPHRHRACYPIHSPEDIEKVNWTNERSQITDFIIAGAGHLDLLYGRAAQTLVQPLFQKIVATAWGQWDYPQK